MSRIISALLAGVMVFAIAFLFGEEPPTPTNEVHGGEGPIPVRDSPNTAYEQDPLYSVQKLPPALRPRSLFGELNISYGAGVSLDYDDGLSPTIIGELEWDVGEAGGWSLNSQVDLWDRSWRTYVKKRIR